MAQSGFTPIKLYLSTTAAAVPLAADLAPGELAINNNDGKLFYEDSSGVVQVIATKAGASGDVVGPASATDNAVARYDGTTGKIIQNSAVTIADDGATVIAANSASDGLRITQLGAGNALVVEDSANPDATPFVVTAAGDAIFGSTTQYGAGIYTTPIVSVNYGNGSTNSGMAVNAWGVTGTTAPRMTFARSAGSLGTYTSVVDASNLGGLFWHGADGTAFIQAASISAAVDGTPGTNDMPGRLVFSTTADGASTPTERMRIRSDGNIGFGGTGTASVSFYNQKNITGSTSAYANYTFATIQSDVTTAAGGYRTAIGTAAAAFTTSALEHFRATQSSLGAGSAITTQYGFVADATLIGATNNYGFISNIASGTGRWNFYAAGTATNYFEGNVAIGNSGFTSGKLNVSGGTIEFDPGSGADSTRAFNFNIGSTNFGKILIPSGSGGAMAFSAGSTVVERFRISSTGTISLGAAVGSESLRVTPVASAVNYLQAQGATTTNFPYFTAQGSDTNVSAGMYSKGTGALLFGSNSGTSQFVISHTASAVNYVQVTGQATGGGPAITAQGTDTNISLNYISKGTGGNIFSSVSGANIQFVVGSTASAVNYHQMAGSATGTALVHSAQGSDTNIDLALTPKGTGVLAFGTYTAGIIAQAGSITIKDAAGNTRRLLVG